MALCESLNDDDLFNLRAEVVAEIQRRAEYAQTIVEVQALIAKAKDEAEADAVYAAAKAVVFPAVVETPAEPVTDPLNGVLP